MEIADVVLSMDFSWYKLRQATHQTSQTNVTLQKSATLLSSFRSYAVTMYLESGINNRLVFLERVLE